MKRNLIVILLLLSGAVLGQAPTKAFDVRNGGPTTITIEFKDTTAKQALIDALCDVGNFDQIDQSKTPITKPAFAMREILFWLREKSIVSRNNTVQKAIVKPDISDLP